MNSNYAFESGKLVYANKSDTYGSYVDYGSVMYGFVTTPTKQGGLGINPGKIVNATASTTMHSYALQPHYGMGVFQLAGNELLNKLEADKATKFVFNSGCDVITAALFLGTGPIGITYLLVNACFRLGDLFSDKEHKAKIAAEIERDMEFRLSLIRARLAQEKEEAFDNFMQCTMVKNNWLARQKNYLLPTNTELDVAILQAIQGNTQTAKTIAADVSFPHYRIFLCFFGKIPRHKEYFDYYNANDVREALSKKVRRNVTDPRLHDMALQDAAKELRKLKIECKFRLHEELNLFGIDKVAKRFLISSMDSQPLKSLSLPNKKKATQKPKPPLSNTIFNQKEDIEYHIIVTLPEEPINEDMASSDSKEVQTQQSVQIGFDDCDLDENEIDDSKQTNIQEALSNMQISKKNMNTQGSYQDMLSSIDVQYTDSNVDNNEYQTLNTFDVGEIKWEEY